MGSQEAWADGSETFICNKSTFSKNVATIQNGVSVTFTGDKTSFQSGFIRLKSGSKVTIETPTANNISTVEFTFTDNEKSIPVPYNGLGASQNFTVSSSDSKVLILNNYNGSNTAWIESSGEYDLTQIKVNYSGTISTDIAVAGISLNKTSATIQIGNTETLTATISPDNATNKTVTWSSSNESVATVNAGVVTAVAAGSATITARSSNNLTATCAVTVVSAMATELTDKKKTDMTAIPVGGATLIVNDVSSTTLTDNTWNQLGDYFYYYAQGGFITDRNDNVTYPDGTTSSNSSYSLRTKGYNQMIFGFTLSEKSYVTVYANTNSSRFFAFNEDKVFKNSDTKTAVYDATSKSYRVTLAAGTYYMASYSSTHFNDPSSLTGDDLHVYAIKVEPAELRDDLSALVKLFTNRTGDFSSATDMGDISWGSDITKNSYSYSKRLGFIANDENYFTLTSGEGFTSHDQQDRKCPFIVIEPQSKGILIVTLKGENPGYGTSNVNRNKVSIMKTMAFDMSDDCPSATEGKNWKVAKYFDSDPGRLYISVYDKQTITGIQWIPNPDGLMAVPVPTVKQNGTVYDLSAQKRDNLNSGTGMVYPSNSYNKVFFADNYIEYKRDSEATEHSDYGTAANVGPSVTTGNVTTKIVAKHVVKFIDSWDVITYFGSAEVEKTYVAYPEFTVSSDGKITITNPVEGLTYYYSQNGVDLTRDNYNSYPTISQKISPAGTYTIKVIGVNDDQTIVTRENWKTDVVVVANPIQNGDFSDQSAWTGLSSDNYQYGCAEKFNTSFDVNQTVPNLQKGLYKLTVNAFTRTALPNDVTAADYVMSEIYAGETAIGVRNITTENLPTSISAGNYSSILGNRVPDNRQAANAAFEDGKYQNELYFVVTTDNSDVTIGIRGANEGRLASCWTCFDNFNLTRVGDVPSSGMSIAPTGSGNRGKDGVCYDDGYTSQFDLSHQPSGTTITWASSMPAYATNNNNIVSPNTLAGTTCITAVAKNSSGEVVDAASFNITNYRIKPLTGSKTWDSEYFGFLKEDGTTPSESFNTNKTYLNSDGELLLLSRPASSERRSTISSDNIYWQGGGEQDTGLEFIVPTAGKIKVWLNALSDTDISNSAAYYIKVGNESHQLENPVDDSSHKLYTYEYNVSSPAVIHLYKNKLGYNIYKVEYEKETIPAPNFNVYTSDGTHEDNGNTVNHEAGQFNFTNYNGDYTYYFTTDGTDPTTSSTKLEWSTRLGPGTYPNGVKMIAVNANGVISEIGSISKFTISGETVSDAAQVSGKLVAFPRTGYVIEGDKFGSVGVTYETTDKPSYKAHFVDNNRLAIETKITQRTGGSYVDRFPTVTNLGLEYTNADQEGVYFKIPTKGMVRITFYGNDGNTQSIKVDKDGARLDWFRNNDGVADENGKRLLVKDYYHETDNEALYHVYFGSHIVDIQKIEYYPIVPLVYTQDETRNWTSSGTYATTWPSGDATYEYPTNDATNSIRINASEANSITVNNTGFVINEKSVNGNGYLSFPAYQPGTVKVWATSVDADSRLSVSAGEKPKSWEDRSTEIPANDPANEDAPAYDMTFFNYDDSRMVFVGATEGVVITRIEWIPGKLENAKEEDLVPVPTDQITYWNKVNNYGGFAIKADGVNSTDIEANILNPGSKAVRGYTATPKNTLMIYGEKQPPYGKNPTANNERTNFSKNGILTLGKSPATGEYDDADKSDPTKAYHYNDDKTIDDHYMKIKVTTCGVLMISGAANGANGRQIRVGLDLTENYLITNETDKASHATHNNNQEHVGNLERHQHDSGHTFYFYFDGEGASEEHPVELFIFGRGGTNYDYIAWMPERNIDEAEGVYDGKLAEGQRGGELVPDGALKISNSSGVVYDDNKNRLIPETICFNSLDKKYYNSWSEWFEGTYYGDDYYRFYANVNVQGHNVLLGNMTPVWTTSQRGRSSAIDTGVLTVNWEDRRDGFTNAGDDPKNQTDLVSYPFEIKPKPRAIANPDAEFPISGADGGSPIPVPTAGNHPGFGIAYVIAGTAEGNRYDYRRVEVAAPAMRLDVKYLTDTKEVDGNTVYEVPAVINQNQSVTVNPKAQYNDLNVNPPYGTLVDIKVDNPTVSWYESNAAGTKKPKDDCILTLIGDDNHDGYVPGTTDMINDLSTLIFYPTETGTTYITASIWGVELQSDNTYKYKEYIQTFEVNIVDKGLYLTRILPAGDATLKVGEKNYVPKVSVTDPIVFELRGNITVTDGVVKYQNGTLESPDDVVINENLPITLTDASNGNTYAKLVNKMKIVPVRDENGEVVSRTIYLIYDVVERLQNIEYSEHMDFASLHEVTFNVSDKTTENTKLYNALGGTSGSSAQYDFNFKTVEDDLGTKIETYIYNVSQRTNDNIDNDIDSDKGDGKLHFVHQITNEEFTPGTHSWYCNKRSYINMSNITKDAPSTNPATLDRILNLIATGSSEIDITPYNYGYGDGERKGMIKKIEINFLPTYNASESEDNAGEVKFYLPTSKAKGKAAYGAATATFDINKDTNYTAIWELDPNGETDKPNVANLTRYARIKFVPYNGNLKIDQIKIYYYSAKDNERMLRRSFDGYTEAGWGEKVTQGIEMETKSTLLADGYNTSEDNHRDSNIKLVFVNDDVRHFMLRERHVRAASDGSGYYRGEKLEREVDLDTSDLPASGVDCEGLTTLIMRDDKTEPFKLYFFTKDNVAEIAKIEFICEDDDKIVTGDDSQPTGGNNLTPRNLYCTSDPRFNPTSVNNHVGYPFEVVTGLTLKDGTSAHKLVYRPESPTNFALIAGDPNETGFFFVRNIVVYYDRNARNQTYELKTPNVGKSFNSNSIMSVGIATKGIQLRIPKKNDIESYTVKRTSSRTNISSEIVLDEHKSTVNEEAWNGEYEEPVLNDLDNTGFTNFKHRKFYTVRILDKNRLVNRQLTFRTVDPAKPVISMNYGSGFVENTDLYAEEPLTTTPTTGDIKIAKVSSDIHGVNNQLIIWTDDASAPKVEFQSDGRRIESIHGKIFAVNGSEYGHLALNSSDYLNGNSKSVVFKAIALPLNGTVTSSMNSSSVVNRGGDSNAILKAISDAGTFCETTDYTRANYVYADPHTTYYSTARRDPNNNKNLEVTLDTEKSVMLNGEVLDNTSLADVYDINKSNDRGFYNFDNYKDKFHSGYYTTVNNGSKDVVNMIYGGYELYAQRKQDNGSWTDDFTAVYTGETYKADRFRRNILKNEYWRVVENDLTPYRGLPGVIGGDAYIVSNVEPLNENAHYDASNHNIEHSDNTLDDMTATDYRRAFVGQFDLTQHDALPTQHDKLWNIPCYGNYFQFEPKSNGTLTVHVKQQGVIEQLENGFLDDKLLRYRPVFILDEAGNTPAGIKAETSSKVSGDWMSMTHTQNVASKYLNEDGQNTLYDVCDTWIKDNTKKDGTTGDNDGDIEYGDRAYHEQGVIAMYGDGYENATKRGSKTYNYTNFENKRSCTAGEATFGARGSGEPNGFMLISEGYVKYQLPVKAGKTYFVFAANGNLGFCSYEFKEDTDYETNKLKCSVKTYKVLNENQSKQANGVFHIGDVEENDGIMIELLDTDNKGKTADVVLHRSFKDGIWSSLVLPFSVSKKQLREALGDGVKVAHFDYVNNKYLYILRHVHQMVVAGTPVFVKPTKNVDAVEGITFNNVTIENIYGDDTEDNTTLYGVKDPIKNKDADYPSYYCKGSFVNTTLPQYSFYVKASDGSFALRTIASPMTIKPTRAWIEYTGGTSGRAVMSAKGMVTSTYSFAADTGEGVDGDVATDIEGYVIDDAENNDGNVYNLKGQLVRRGTEDLEGLPQGVYIINGVKHVVK